jgi:hypothetical protein
MLVLDVAVSPAHPSVPFTVSRALNDPEADVGVKIHGSGSVGLKVVQEPPVSPVHVTVLNVPPAVEGETEIGSSPHELTEAGEEAVRASPHSTVLVSVSAGSEEQFPVPLTVSIRTAEPTVEDGVNVHVLGGLLMLPLNDPGSPESKAHEIVPEVPPSDEPVSAIALFPLHEVRSEPADAVGGGVQLTVLVYDTVPVHGGVAVMVSVAVKLPDDVDGVNE